MDSENCKQNQSKAITEEKIIVMYIYRICKNKLYDSNSTEDRVEIIENMCL